MDCLNRNVFKIAQRLKLDPVKPPEPLTDDFLADIVTRSVEAFEALDDESLQDEDPDLIY